MSLTNDLIFAAGGSGLTLALVYGLFKVFRGKPIISSGGGASQKALVQDSIKVETRPIKPDNSWHNPL